MSNNIRIIEDNEPDNKEEFNSTNNLTAIKPIQEYTSLKDFMIK